jgi:5'-deoxynucleotidase YfbR-like HD superfamily hydrolase
MLGFGALASRAFNALIQVVTPTPPGPTWGSKGGIGKKRKESIKKSHRAEMQEHLEALFAEPVAQELKEEVKEYVKPSQGFSIHSIDYGKLARDIELVQRIMQKAQEIRDEQEDEAILLMLM